MGSQLSKKGLTDRQRLIQQRREAEIEPLQNKPVLVTVEQIQPEDGGPNLPDHVLMGPQAKHFIESQGIMVFVMHYISKGSFGAVYGGMYSDGGECACKIIRVNKLRLQDPDLVDTHLPRELDIISRLDHPNVVKVFRIFEQRNQRIFIFMEKATKGNLMDHVQAKKLTEDEARFFFKQLAQGLNYMHAMGCCHRDVKPDNALLFRNQVLKLTDFSFARSIFDPHTGRRVRSETYVGTPAFRAPEIYMAIPYEPLSADVFMAGVSLFVMLNKEYPFYDPEVRAGAKAWNRTDKRAYLTEQLNRNYVWKPDVFTASSDEVKDLIHIMLDPKAENRPQMHEVLEHPWLEPVSVATPASGSASASGSSQGATAGQSARGFKRFFKR